MKSELEDLDADILALLAHAKPVADLDGARKAALLADVMDKIGVPPIGGGGGGGAGAGATTGVGTKLAVGVAFAVGVAAGVAGDRALVDRGHAPMTAPTVIATTAAPSASPPSSAESVSVDALPSAKNAAPVPSAKAPSEPMPSARGLAAERALLDVARSDLARGEASAALDAAERHRREYPDGALVEEREAIAIKALVALGRRDEAARRLDVLEKNYPNSLVLRAAKKAVSGTP